MRTTSSSGMSTAKPHTPSIFRCALRALLQAPCSIWLPSGSFSPAVAAGDLLTLFGGFTISKRKATRKLAHEVSWRKAPICHLQCVLSVLQNTAILERIQCDCTNFQYGNAVQGSYRTHRACCRHPPNRRNIQIAYPSINYTVFSKYLLKFQVRFPSMHPERAWSSETQCFLMVLSWCPWARCLRFNCSRSQVQDFLSTDSDYY